MLDKLEKILEKNNVFLSGAAGTGKSYLVNSLQKSYKNRKKLFIALSPSALAAINIEGQTIQSFFKFRHCKDIFELKELDRKQFSGKSGIEKFKKLNDILKALDLIIVDEISMVSANLMEMISYRLSNSNFQGKFLLVGDFYQLPPIQKNIEKSLFSSSFYAFDSNFWHDLKLKYLKLESSKRTQNESFYQYLQILSKGKINKEILNFFENLRINQTQLDDLNDDFTLLCALNARALKLNSQKLAKLKTPSHFFQIQAYKDDESLDEASFEAWIKSLGLIENLELKIGARVIFCVNDKEKNFYNGEQGVIIDFTELEGEKLIKIQKNDGSIILLKQSEFSLEEYIKKDEEITLLTRARVKAFAIKLAYAITIHKSQGMSIEKLVCDIDNIFENGQLYVALSRAILPENLKIFYSRSANFGSHFEKILKIDEKVSEFYSKNEFENLEN